MRSCLSIIILIFLGFSTQAQTYLGARLGPNMSRSAFSDKVYNSYNQSLFSPGFTGGIMVINETSDLVGIQTDISYSMKRRFVKNSSNDFQTNKATYHHIDMPILFRLKFKSRNLSYYFLGGPELSYWLAGNGRIGTFDFNDGFTTNYDYDIRFSGEPDLRTSLVVNEPNRFHIGLSAGVGWSFSINDVDYFGVEVRYTMGHTNLGAESGGETPAGVIENFESTNRVFSVTGIYYFNMRERFKVIRRKMAK